LKKSDSIGEKKKLCANHNSNTIPKKGDDSNTAARPQDNNGHVGAAQVRETETHARSGTDIQESKMPPISLVKELTLEDFSRHGV
jgi:hypothetical protein